MNKEFKIQNRRWMQVLLAIIVLGAALILLKNGQWELPKKPTEKAKQGELVKMMGIKNTPPEKSPSYQSVTGVLDLQHWTTQHGVAVYFVHVPTLPMVDIDIIFDAGAARDGDKGGIASLTNALLASGTATLSADQVAENFDEVGAQFTANSLRDMASVHLRSLSEGEQLIPAVQTLASILSQPAFRDNDFTREQQHALTALKQQEQMPDKLAARNFFDLLYANQPYAHWVLGSEATVKALTPQDLKAFYQKYYVAKNAVVVIVGDISAQTADAIVQVLTKDLPQGEHAPALPPVAPLKEPVTKKISFPSAQTHILIGEPGMKQNDPDYYALMVGNHILGGGAMVSRIFQTIRNEHALAYSAYSFFQPMREQGPFILGCQTRNDQADKAANMLKDLLKTFVQQGPTENELNQAKQNLLGGYALEFESNLAICRQVAMLGFYGLPLNYFNAYKPAVEKITVEDIKQAFQKRISPDTLVTVMLGGEPGQADKESEKPPHGDLPTAMPSRGQH